jgi:hypothetical protein
MNFKNKESTIILINKKWHLDNPKPDNPCIVQRILWHLSHLENCNCIKNINPFIKDEILSLKPDILCCIANYNNKNIISNESK